MIQKTALVIALVMLTIPTRAAWTQEANPFDADIEVWREDLQTIVHDIRAIHPDPFTKIGELTFMRQAEALEDALPTMTSAERVVGLMQLVASLGDGHSGIELLSPAYAQWYPIRILHFADGYYVTSAHRSVSELAGAQVIEIAGRPVDEVVNRARTLMGADNDLDNLERMYAVHNAFLMQGMGYANEDGSVRMRFRGRNGHMINRTMEPVQGAWADGSLNPIFDWHFYAEVYGLPIGTSVDWVSAFGDVSADTFRTADENRPPFMGLRRRYYRRHIPESDSVYLQLNQTDDTDFVPFIRDTLSLVDEVQPEHFIIDLRNDFGGDGSIANEMIREFIMRQPDTPWENLYVLTGRKTFSAAMVVLDAFVEHANPTIIGEPAGQPFNFYGDNEWRMFPRLGLRLEVSALRHQMAPSDDLSPYISVDVPAIWTFDDYIHGRDPAVDPILRGEDMRSIPNIALSEGGDAARVAYRTRLAAATGFEWWSPPEEIVLRRVCDELVREERFEEAVQTCTLNTEIHPTIWNTWYNLAGSLRDADRAEERWSPYHCVTEMAPTNWNVPDILAAMENAGLNVEDIPLPEGCPVAR